VSSFGRAHKSDKRCPKACLGTTFSIRTAAEYGIPNEIWATKASDEKAYHCYHCGLVWFQGSGPRATLIGHYRGSKVFDPMPEQTKYVENERPARKPKAPKKRGRK
jgi:hypothetical protein